MMLHLLLVVFVQSGLAVQAASARLDGPYTTAECAALEARESKVLPLQQGDDARWQYAKCIQVLSINEPAPIGEWRYP